MATCWLQPCPPFPVAFAVSLSNLQKPCLLSPTHFFLHNPLFLPISPAPPAFPLTLPFPSSGLHDSPPLPPSSRDEALLQARTSIANLLVKPLRHAGPSTLRHRKSQRQLRLRVEIPLLDDSASARASFLLDLLDGFSVGKRGDPVSFAVLCDSDTMDRVESARRADKHCKVRCHDMASARDLCQDTQVVVLFSPKLSDVTCVENITRIAALRPVVLLNPEWSADEETEIHHSEFLQSFDVVYSYIPLAIQGLFSKTEGAVLKHVRSGAPSGRPWFIFVKDGNEMKCVSSLMKRPNAVDLENALYSSMAENSPVTKSIKFLRGLTGGR